MQSERWACAVVIGEIVLFWCVALLIYSYRLKPSETPLEKLDNVYAKAVLSTRWREYFLLFFVTAFFLFRGALGPFMWGLATLTTVLLHGNSPCVDPDSWYGQAMRDVWDQVVFPWIKKLGPI